MQGVLLRNLDNFASHRSKMLKKRTLKLDIRLVFLTPYSLDLYHD